MVDTRTAPYAALILRITLGILFLAHAGLKVFVFTPAGAALAYLTIAAETAGGIALIVGFFTRWVSLALIPVLLGAIAFVHGPAGFFFNNPNGGWEYLAFWIAALVTQALLGDGALAVRAGSAKTAPALSTRSA
jgi:putative oxidoreductase